jgi:serine/threonine-protein kinase
VALKSPKNNSAEKRFKRSAVVAAKVNHPNIAKTLDYVESDNRQYLIEELIEGKDLETALLAHTGCVDPYLGGRLFHHLAKGIAAAHHAGVWHRDLKPTNVMATGGYKLQEIKITDFGIAKMADEELADAAEKGESTLSTNATAVGALPYMAPEAIDAPRSAGRPADIWSLGAMMYRFVTGQLPFGAGLRAVGKILEAAPPSFPAFLSSNPQFAPLSAELMQLILSCLAKDPLARPDADELVRKCGMMCYPVDQRLIGTVRKIQYEAWGFILCEGKDIFFNMSSVYGARPKEGEQVVLSKYAGGGADRAHPVVVVQSPAT